MTEWSKHVHRFAKKHNMSYKQANVSKKCKEAYKKRRTSPRKKMSPQRRKTSSKKKRGTRMNAGGTNDISRERKSEFPPIRETLPSQNEEKRKDPWDGDEEPKEIDKDLIQVHAFERDPEFTIDTHFYLTLPGGELPDETRHMKRTSHRDGEIIQELREGETLVIGTDTEPPDDDVGDPLDYYKSSEATVFEEDPDLEDENLFPKFDGDMEYQKISHNDALKAIKEGGGVAKIY